MTPFVEVKGYPYSRCATCGFVFLNPMPTQIDLNESYQGHKAITADFYPHSASRRRKALLRALRLARFILGKRVLDIGCGGGFFVNAARRLSAEATGLDVDTQSIAYARRHFPQCNFIQSSFDDFRADQPFDFVHCSEVIEHLPDPHALMRLLRQCCRTGSHVFITTPDLGSPDVPGDISSWPGFAPPAHVGLFNEHNLTRLFEQHGFQKTRTLRRRKTGMKIVFRYNKHPTLQPARTADEAI